MATAIINGKLTSKIGRYVSVVTPSDTTTKITWSGHAKRTNIAFWQERSDARVVYVRASSFMLEGQSIRLPLKALIKALYLRTDVYLNGSKIGVANTVKILTRIPFSPWERNFSNSWPLVLKEDKQIITFSNKDMRSIQYELNFG